MNNCCAILVRFFVFLVNFLFRSNRENSPENPNYKIDEDEGIKQFKILDKIGEGTYGQVIHLLVNFLPCSLIHIRVID